MRRSQKNQCVDAKVANVKLPDVRNGCEHLDVISFQCGVDEEDSGQLQVRKRPKLPEVSSGDAQAQLHRRRKCPRNSHFWHRRCSLPETGKLPCARLFSVGNEHGTRHKHSLPCVQRRTLGNNATHGKMTVLPSAALGEEVALGLTLDAVNCSQRHQFLPWVRTKHTAK